jgi:hypothetical protein
MAVLKIRTPFSEIINGIAGILTEVYGTTLILYQDVTSVVYQIHFNGATKSCKLEFTNSTDDEINAGTAVWFESTGITSDVLTPINAPNGIRLKNLGTGSVYFSVRLNR